MTTYDVAIIGMGSSGCFIAEVLSRLHPGKSFLLVDAGWDPGMQPYVGPTSPDPVKQRKIAWRANIVQDPLDNQDADWNYTVNGSVTQSYGKQVGGSSNHNGAQSFFPTQTAVNAWGLQANGWTFANLLPSLNTVKTKMNVKPYFSSRTDVKMTPVVDTYLNSIAAFNWGDGLPMPYLPDLDAAIAANPNFDRGSVPTGGNLFGGFDQPWQGGTNSKQPYGKVGAYWAALTDALARPNVTLSPMTLVKDIVHNGSTASAITILNRNTGATSTVNVGNVIVSACAIGSPALLLRSNIGPAPLGGSPNPWVNLPVGQYFKNQSLKSLNVEFNKDVYNQFGYGIPITTTINYANQANHPAWFNFSTSAGSQISALPTYGTTWKDKARNWRRYVGASIVLQDQTAVGTLALNPTGNIEDNPVIITWTEASDDITALNTYVSQIVTVLNNINSLPSSQSNGLQVTDIVVNPGFAAPFHAVGTCKMGTGPTAVTSPTDCKVLGFNNITVCDGSILPGLVASPSIPLSALGYYCANNRITLI